MTVIVDMKDEVIEVIVDGKEVTKIEFINEGNQITIASIGTETPYQKCGYGRLAFEVLKLLSEQYKLPIVLWSLDPAVPFYEQIGLLHLNNPEVQKKVMFGNVEIKELKEKINNNDFVYMPQSLYRRKPIIYL
jgi:hypothetical protein